MSFTIFSNKKATFQVIKTRTSKSRKIDIFPKGLTHDLSPKMAIFPTLFLGNIGQENVFYDILQRKATFQAIKTRSSKHRKIDIFPKGITHGFDRKIAIFPTFFFQALQARKMPFAIFQHEKTPFQAIKQEVENVEKLTHGFGPKMAIFPTFFFQAIYVRKMSFTIFYNKKGTFQAIKTRSSKSRKIDIFPKGLTHGFGPKMAIFPTYFFYAILARKMSFTKFYNVKPTFQDIKTKSLKNRKIIIFPKGLTHGFGPKWPFFQPIFLMQYWPGKCLLRNFTT